jgi:uncharacterized OsmC-like protein
MEMIINKGVGVMQEKSKKKKKYKKKNEFKFNIVFNNNGETLERIVERAFGNYCKNKI